MAHHKWMYSKTRYANGRIVPRKPKMSFKLRDSKVEANEQLAIIMRAKLARLPKNGAM